MECRLKNMFKATPVFGIFTHDLPAAVASEPCSHPPQSTPGEKMALSAVLQTMRSRGPPKYVKL